MNLYRAGAAYTVSAHYGWLARAGFRDARHATLAGGSMVIWATKKNPK
jgi:hypothetical protein